MAQALFINREDIVKFTALNGNVDPDKFTAFVKIAQDIHIQNVLGSNLFQKINNDIVASSISGVYLSLLTTYIKPMLIHWAMVEYLPFAAYTIANKGVYKHGSENADTISVDELNVLIDKERSIAQHYQKRFLDYICLNSNSFPEYSNNTGEDMYPDRNQHFTSWVI